MVYALERGSSEHFRLSEGADMMSEVNVCEVKNKRYGASRFC